jgi:hypothetical protein
MNLKVFKILEPPSKDYTHPQEDYLLILEKYPIFAVADGTTLIFNKEEGCPEISGTGEVAKIFCEKSIEVVEKLYDGFSEKNILEAFDYANQSIKEYNTKNNRIKETINFGTLDFFHTAAALAVIKENRIFYGTICDAGILLIDKNGRKKFNSPRCDYFNKLALPDNWEALNDDDKCKPR